MHFNPHDELLLFPLDRIVEVHLSGLDKEDGIFWDNHAAAIPNEVWDLLRILLSRTSVDAITFEYNWATSYPMPSFLNDLDRVRTLISDGPSQWRHPS
jgi:uncharacterized protein (UPF0276 family)